MLMILIFFSFAGGIVEVRWKAFLKSPKTNAFASCCYQMTKIEDDILQPNMPNDEDLAHYNT